MPDAYVRQLVADRWHLPPWAVDAAPVDEYALVLALMTIESETEQS